MIDLAVLVVIVAVTAFAGAYARRLESWTMHAWVNVWGGAAMALWVAGTWLAR